MINSNPLVWYVAAGYGLPAGIEAYLLHYATEMRNHGFRTRIVVFYPLPAMKHRYLVEVERRGIPITSLYDETAAIAVVLFVVMFLPWLFYMLVIKGKTPQVRGFRSWVQNRCAVRRLGRLLAEESPDIIHVKGRMPTNAWKVFPAERTIYHHALMGTVDPSWTDSEVEDFRVFANRIACIFTPGRGVAETLAREFRIERPIEPLFTMAPDEAVNQSSVNSNQLKERREKTRFGIVCRFTEQKGIPYILSALKDFREKYGDVFFTFAGQGELETTIREFVDLNGMKNVRIVGVPSAVDVLREMDVFVHPGLDDAMPVSIVEALMCGVPCVATRVGGVPDLVRDGVEGFLVEPRMAGQVFASMERFALMGTDEFQAFRTRARKRYEEVCTPDKVGKTVAEHYRRILAGIKQETLTTKCTKDSNQGIGNG
jgi:glycosyltransferase involved in cell wall biosynthesis